MKPFVSSRSFVWVAGIVIAFALAGARPAAAQAGNCTITTVSNVAFGSYDVFGAGPLDSTGRIRYLCSNLNGGSISIDLSKGNAPSYNPRFMLKGAERLNYNLYLDAAMTNIWGNNTGGSLHYTAVPPDDTNVNVTIFGRIPAGQDVSAGAYSDNVVATINF